VERCCKIGFDRSDLDVVADLASGRGRPRPATIIQTALRHKVASHVYDNLGSVAAAHPHLEMVRDLRRTFETDFAEFVTPGRTQKLLAELPTLARAMRAAGLHWLPTKGGALTVLGVYPEARPRYIRDLDLIAPDLPSAWRTLTVLEELGYQLQPPLLLQRTRQGRFLAIAILRKKRDGVSLKIEVMVQPFKTTLFSNLEVDLWAGAREVEFGGETISVPSPENLFLMTASHAYHDGATLKDANDMWLLLGHFGTVCDWSAVARLAAANGLAAGFGALTRMTEGLYGPTPLLKRLVRDLRPTAAERAVSRLLARGGGKSRIPLVWAYHIRRQTGANPIGAFLRLVRRSALLRVLTSPRCPETVDLYLRREERRGLRGWAKLARAGLPFYLVPLSWEESPARGGNGVGAGTSGVGAGTSGVGAGTSGRDAPVVTTFADDEIAHVRERDAQCLLTPVGPFLPTRYGVLDDGQITAGSDLASRVTGGRFLQTRQSGERGGEADGYRHGGQGLEESTADKPKEERLVSAGVS
jgi:hypothetical protein